MGLFNNNYREFRTHKEYSDTLEDYARRFNGHVNLHLEHLKQDIKKLEADKVDLVKELDMYRAFLNKNGIRT